MFVEGFVFFYNRKKAPQKFFKAAFESRKLVRFFSEAFEKPFQRAVQEIFLCRKMQKHRTVGQTGFPGNYPRGHGKTLFRVYPQGGFHDALPGPFFLKQAFSLLLFHNNDFLITDYIVSILDPGRRVKRIRQFFHFAASRFPGQESRIGFAADCQHRAERGGFETEGLAG
jgi:hypothetical protein